ncbi:hypothetical protein [Pontibacter burrus]|uniref:Uncharacterized protein n=1 Tax=Pontibacter burrus TaxID=2704466 RepID=A0A6B3LRY3_9BACT|nr:hypothetical protein [Pontibacter burrus]NEM96738.1 hypothetical protein [Pontibacter burrus]
MKDNQNKDQQNQQGQQQKGSSSNPQNSFQAGKQGGQKSQQITNQGSNNPNAMGNSASRTGNQNKPTQGAGQGSRMETDQSGQKDISNNLKNDAVGQFGSNNPTPQARTDNEQDNARNQSDQ